MGVGVGKLRMGLARRLSFVAAAALLAVTAVPAAADIADWTVSPFTTSIGDLNFNLGGDANGAAFLSSQPSFPDLDKGGVTGALRFFPSLERDFDSGLVVGVHASILAFHDRLSDDRYGGRVFEKAYVLVQSGLGSVELGDTDGPGYRLAITGPRVDEKTSIDDHEITFFRDPLTGRAFDDVFTVRTESGTSLDFAKLAYYSPRLFGVELAFSYAPSESREVLPFLSKGPHVNDRQQNLWEFGANYDGTLGPLSVGAYGALSVGHDAMKTLGHEGLTDWAAGGAVSYPVNDDLKLSLGGSYRTSNAYAFDLNDVLADGSTRALHASAKVTYGSWIAGFETTDGTADGAFGQPSLNVHGYEASLGYVLNSNLQLTAGWQQLRYSRSSGFFYSGPRFAGDAYFLHLDFHV